MNYLVTWNIDIEADSPKKAAEDALRIHRDPDSIATVFKVCDEKGESWDVDLSNTDLHWKDSPHLQTQNGEVHCDEGAWIEGAWITAEERSKRMKKRRNAEVKDDTCESDGKMAAVAANILADKEPRGKT